MIFAVAMTFIDQTIVSIAAPTVQHDLGLSSSGMQWAINAYLLALAALFAFGGRLGDTVGHRTMVVVGVIVFAAASALCGATPRGGAAEAWLVTFVPSRAWAVRSCSPPRSPSWWRRSTCAHGAVRSPSSSASRAG
ncbi:MAG: MFS transporter [Trebonia sp.]